MSSHNYIVTENHWIRTQQIQDFEESNFKYRYWGPVQWPVLQKERPTYKSVSKSTKVLPPPKPQELIRSNPRTQYSPQTVLASDCFQEVFGSEYLFFGQDYTPIPKRPAEAHLTTNKIAGEVTPAVTAEATLDMITRASGGRWWRRMLEAISIFSFRGPKA